MSKIAIIILAAGKSKRMGFAKQIIRINNEPLLKITLDKIESISEETYCVLGANKDLILEEIHFNNTVVIDNINYEKGLSSSISICIEFFEKKNLNYDGVLFVLGDQPAIETEYFLSIIKTFNEHKTKIIATNYDGKAGVPALFPKSFFKELKIIKGDKGAREILKNKPKSIIFESFKTNLVDIDTRKDLIDYNK
ncbi:nucleotidyltransferase family protein [Polaribacter marinivivus]|jgi:molybdenum cofactor cytidylyltransferase|uniref:nucleotidyltransferase family protein n=1 Tax=Polaribacter marinivivus TaxID=1524260 RepID=UPI003D34343D